MMRTGFSQLSGRILAVLLTLLLLAPSAAMAQSAGPPDKTEHTAPAPDNSSPNAPQPLSEEEVADLSERAEEPGPEVEGGALSNLHLTYAVIALAAAVIVLLAK